VTNAKYLPKTDEQVQAFSALVDAIRHKDKYAIAACLRSTPLTNPMQAHAFVVAASETVNEALGEEGAAK